MTHQEARKYLKKILEIADSRDCCDVEIDAFYEEAIKLGISALGAIEQFRWERDVAIGQLRELGLELGLKTDDVQQAINFKKYFDELYGEGLEVANWHLNGDLEPFDNFYESALQNGN